MKIYVYLLALLCSFSAVAKEGGGKIAVIDMERLMSESLAYKSVQSAMEKQNAKYQSEIKVYETKILDLDKEISQNPKKLSTEQLSKLKADLEKKEVEAQKILQKRRMSLENAMVKAIENIKNELFVINENLAKENSLQVILPKSQTLYSAENIDYTNVVLEKINLKLPTLEVKFED